MESIYKITLDTQKDSYQATLTGFVVADTNSRTIVANIVNGRNPMTFATDTFATLTCVLPDDATYTEEITQEQEQSCEVCENTIRCTLNNSILFSEGEVRCQFHIFNKDGETIASPKFKLVVTERLFESGKEAFTKKSVFDEALIDIDNLKATDEVIAERLEEGETAIVGLLEGLGDANTRIEELDSGLASTNEHVNEVHRIATELSNSKQDKLVSGTNIKTINNNSLLGNGNININDQIVDGFDSKRIGWVDLHKIGTSGASEQVSTISHTDFIPVTGGTQYLISGITYPFSSGMDSVKNAWYSDNREDAVIEVFNYVAGNYVKEAPDNAKYLRISVRVYGNTDDRKTLRVTPQNRYEYGAGFDVKGLSIAFGKSFGQNNEEVANNSYSFTDFIPIVPGHIYGWNGIAYPYASGRERVAYVLYDSNKQPIRRANISSASSSGYYICEDGVAYIRFSLYGNKTTHLDVDTFRFFPIYSIGGGGGGTEYTFTNGLKKSGTTVSADMDYITSNVIDSLDENYYTSFNTAKYRKDEIITGASGTNPWIQASGVKLTDLQSKLVSGTNIKTINNESILGSGNIEIQGGGGGSSVYIATYGTPAVDAITQAIADGKTVLLNVSNKTYAFLVRVETSYYYFLSANFTTSTSRSFYSYYVSRTQANKDTWGSAAIDFELKNNMTQTLSSTSTASQYPSAKAVYDYIESRLGGASK